MNEIKKSKYEKNIQLILAGKGPWKEHLEMLSKDLTNKVIFNFYSQDELLKIINFSDLYIHSSDAEIEAISCMEALATNQFALDDRNLFEAGNSESLKKKIEYWIEHPEEKKIQSKKYIEYAKKYNIENCVKEMEKFFTEN